MIEIDTVADDPDSGDGLIHVSLVEGAGYALSRDINDTTFSTLVLDPFIPPTLTITPAEPNVIEGRGCRIYHNLKHSIYRGIGCHY